MTSEFDIIPADVALFQNRLCRLDDTMDLWDQPGLSLEWTPAEAEIWNPVKARRREMKREWLPVKSSELQELKEATKVAPFQM